MAAASQPTVGILPEEADLHTADARVNKHKADWRGWKFMWPFTVVFVFVFIIPIVYAVYISFFKKQMIGGMTTPSPAMPDSPRRRGQCM